MWRKRPWRRLVTSPPTLQQKYVERGGLSFSAWFPVGVPTLGAPRPAVGGVGGLSLGRGWWGRLRLSLSTCQMSPVSLSFLSILLAGSRKCWHCQKWSQVPNHFHSQCRLQKVKTADQNVGTGSLNSVPPRSVYGKFNGHTQSSRRRPIRARLVVWGQGGAVASYTSGWGKPLWAGQRGGARIFLDTYLPFEMYCDLSHSSSLCEMFLVPWSSSYAPSLKQFIGWVIWWNRGVPYLRCGADYLFKSANFFESEGRGKFQMFWLQCTTIVGV